MSAPVAILGAGGFGREVLDILEAIRARGEPLEVAGFLVEEGFGEAGASVNDRPVLGGFDWLERHASEVDCLCAVGDPALRRRLVERARRCGARFRNAIHPAAVLTRRVEAGTGVVIGAGSVLTNRIRIGDHVHVNLLCTVGHDAVLGDFATLAPGVHVSGGVRVGEGAHLGTGANVIEGISVGEWSVLGAGATAVRDVPANATAVGVPCRVIRTRPAGWHLA